MTTFLTLLFAGLALGGIYALVAIGFTVIYRSSRVINFAQGEMLALGALITSSLISTYGLTFFAAFLVGVTATAIAGFLFQFLVLRFAVGKPEFTIVMLTLGLAAILNAVLDSSYGAIPRPNGDPWGASVVKIGSVSVEWVQVWTVITALLLLVLFWLFNQRTKWGIAIRSAATDPEAAAAVGIPLRRVYATSWVLAGVVACVGGVFLGGYPNSVSPSISDAALLAFPAIILGGLESTTGAVIGGFIIGVVQELTQGYQPTYVAWLGSEFYTIAPYVLMIIVLLVRPQGLFGERSAERL